MKSKILLEIKSYNGKGGKIAKSPTNNKKGVFCGNKPRHLPFLAANLSQVCHI